MTPYFAGGKVNLPKRRPMGTEMTNSATYWIATYYPRCLILLAKHRSLPSNMSFAATIKGIALMQVRPHWLRG